MSNIINKELRESLIKEAIALANEFSFGDNAIVSSSNLRNLLNFINNPFITHNQFNLFARYQAARDSDSRYHQFTKKMLDIISKQIKDKPEQLKIPIIREFLQDIVMAGTYRKETNEKIQLI